MAIGLSNAPGAAQGFLSRRQRYEFMKASLIGERRSFEAHWQELASHLKPRRLRLNKADHNRGDRRNQNIIDSTPLYALRTLQSGLHAGLTSPARPWLRLSTPDPDLADFKPVKEWLHTVTQRMLTVFLRSNLYNALPTLYGDMGGFATGAMALLEDRHDLMRAYAYPLGSYAVGLDARGVVNTFVREYSLSVRQLVEQFGVVPGTRDIDWTGLSTEVKQLWDVSSYDAAVAVTWIVTPNLEYDPTKLRAKYAMPFQSCWFEDGRADDGKFLRESGFRQFPVLVPRWDVTAEDIYGTDCPGMTALGDIKALQIMQRRKAQAIDKAINPPLQGPSALRTQKTSLLPGDVTYVDGSRDALGLRPIHEVRLEGVQHFALDIQDTQERVRRAFFEDLFLMLAMSDRRGAQPVTAREIEERHEEKLLLLGPVLERTNDELLDPLVDRAFAIMDAAGAIPEAPPELEGMDLKVEYISLMSQAQKLVGVAGHERFLQTSVSLMEAFPEVRHKVDIFTAIDDSADMLGVNPKIVVSSDDARAAQQAEAQAAQQAAQTEQLKNVAGAAQALGNTPMGGDTALQSVVDGIDAEAA